MQALHMSAGHGPRPDSRWHCDMRCMKQRYPMVIPDGKGVGSGQPTAVGNAESPRPVPGRRSGQPAAMSSDEQPSSREASPADERDPETVWRDRLAAEGDEGGGANPWAGGEQRPPPPPPPPPPGAPIHTAAQRPAPVNQAVCIQGVQSSCLHQARGGASFAPLVSRSRRSLSARRCPALLRGALG